MANWYKLRDEAAAEKKKRKTDDADFTPPQDFINDYNRTPPSLRLSSPAALSHSH